MPISDYHPTYKNAAPDVRVCRDVSDGERAVKASGLTYLPMLSGMSTVDYLSYQARATVLDAVSATVTGAVGQVFRKPVAVEIPETLAGLADRIGWVGARSLAVAAAHVIREVLLGYRFGILVDQPRGFVSATNLPRWAGYPTEAIRNWGTTEIEGEEALAWLVLEEEEAVAGADQYEHKTRRVFRECFLDGLEGFTPTYRQRLWRETEGKQTGPEAEFVAEEPVTPLKRGLTLDRIPFVSIGALSLDIKPKRPTMLPLAQLVLHHYRGSADHQHGLHFTALPTPYVCGEIDEDDDELKIGSMTAWHIPDSSAKVGMLEFTGAGLGAVADALERKEAQLAAFGARLLSPKKKVAETAEALRLVQGAENASLVSIVKVVSSGLTEALRLAIEWAGGNPEEGSVELNTDLIDHRIPPDELRAILEAWYGGVFPKRIVHYNLRRGELYPDDMTDDELDELVEAEEAAKAGLKPEPAPTVIEDEEE